MTEQESQNVEPDEDHISIVKTYSLKDSLPSCSSGIPLEVLGDHFPDDLRLPRGAKSHYWKYFGLKPIGSEIDKSKVYCKLCRSALAYHGSTTCLSQHLFHMHQEQYMECHRAKQVRVTPSFLPPLPDSMAKNRAKAKAAREHRAKLRQENATTSGQTSKESVYLTSILADLCWMLTVPGHNWNELVSKRRQTPEDVVVSLVKCHQKSCELCISHREEQLLPSKRKKPNIEENDNDDMMSIEMEEEKVMPAEKIKKELPDPEDDMIEEEAVMSTDVKVKEEEGQDNCAICRQTFSEDCGREADIFKDVLPDSGTPILDKLTHILSQKDPLECTPTHICTVCFEDLRKMDAIECDLRKRNRHETLRRENESEQKLEQLLSSQHDMLINQKRIMRQQKTLMQLVQSIKDAPRATTLLQPPKSNLPVYTVIYGATPKSNS